MAKHLIGFGLFISIVGFFGTAFWFFSSSTVAEVEVIEIPNTVSSWTFCDKKRRPKDLGSPRAIADRWNGTITVYLNELPGGSSVDSSELNASFTFYAVSGDKVRLMDVVHDSLVRSVRRDAGPKWILRYDAPWVKGLPWEQNLYVMPSAGGVVPTEFSIDSAMPVLIKN